MEILSVKNLKKSFGEKQVLKDVDLSVSKNCVFGFVGENGAGKTTTMKAILGLLKIDQGEILVAGERVNFGQTPTNRFIGYLPDVPEFYSFLNAREYLKLCGNCLNMSKTDIKNRSEELLSLVGLENEKSRIKGYSRGMKQRLGIASALLSRPKLLICDEPTSALDPIGRKQVLDILKLVKNQTAVLFSTHVLTDVERVCDKVALLHDGKIALCGSVEELKQMDTGDRFTVETQNINHAKLLANTFEHATLLSPETVVFEGDKAKTFEVIDFINKSQIEFNKIERSSSSLESLFIKVVKK